jgi:hypothetical protein
VSAAAHPGIPARADRPSPLLLCPSYVYDTPYHVGNSPSNGTNARWTEFISFLRQAGPFLARGGAAGYQSLSIGGRPVCVTHGKQLFFRSWDNWASDPAVYHSITDPILPHPLLYFSIKHSSGKTFPPPCTLGRSKLMGPADIGRLVRACAHTRTHAHTPQGSLRALV